MNESKTIYALLLILFISSVSIAQSEKKYNDQFVYAKSRTNDLKLSIYITAHAVNNLLATEEGMREAISLFHANGVTKAYLEVYRGGLLLEESLLKSVRDKFLKNEIEVVGGIATVPGGDFGVKQEGKLGWFNWQNPKTQNDLKEVITMAAKVFDEFIVDDFLCTADTSNESKNAKGNRSWSEYRRDLLTKLSNEIFIEHAKKVNPNIKMIIKYPQWYDRFHLFGYDLANEPQLFDKVWVGTETRGQYTQRFGFVQPFEGFINYRWIKDITGEKIGGAWFDHGDCDRNDFIEQAYQSVLAGAKEIVLFNYFDFVNGHKGHHLLRYQFKQLADLASSVADNQVVGVAAYKPINSNAGGDLYIMDFIGTLGIPLVPVHQYPEDAQVIFLPRQAASDVEILSKVKNSISKGSTVIFTAGFLANAVGGKELTDIAGVKYPVEIHPQKAIHVLKNKMLVNIEYGLALESKVSTTHGETILTAAGKATIPYFIKSHKDAGTIYTINTHTFSQKDFDKVGEVLLSPKPLGMLEIPRSWVNTIRDAFTTKLNFKLDAPARIVIQPLGSSGWVLHNYNNTQVSLTLESDEIKNTGLVNGFTGEAIEHHNNKLNLSLEPRSRIWIKVEKE